ncbi:MAG: citrate/2-methylcitrate synthase [Ruminococcus sp.]|nr:citrate/2-methylcitrate synthase [Ruminococcus sp.]MCM1382090.1 citrate/2-methylcitrate synthase [Muribaculaceae bacterium]MCM1479186.1 citrate/2-methylcitrate synthase [Muribaculaceae bacterium]
MSSNYNFSKITPEIVSLSELCRKNGGIDPELYTKYDVKRGLRDLNGKGVLAGLTEISDIISSKEVDGQTVPCDGELYYRGYNINDLVGGFTSEKRFGFEEITYLLLFGELPNRRQLSDFSDILANYRQLPTTFVRDIIMKSPSEDIMNGLARGVLTLYSYDDMPNDTSIPNVLRQSLELIALFPLIAVYSYQAKAYYHDNDSFFIHQPNAEYSTAENILHMLRPDSSFTKLEASILDLALVLHAEHGGGNNSTFTTHVVTSSGTDTYSAIAAALASLKGPKHGGANIKVTMMFEDMKDKLTDWEDEDAIKDYLVKLLHKEAFDRSGLIYGMGHAVYSVSDPRAAILRRAVKALSIEKKMEKEYALYNKIERLAPEVIAKERRIYKGVSANIDFYSGFAYSILGLPPELYTPIFAIARISGWSAHRIEELLNAGKIIRPAYKAVQPHNDYVAISERN